MASYDEFDELEASLKADGLGGGSATKYQVHQPANALKRKSPPAPDTVRSHERETKEPRLFVSQVNDHKEKKVMENRAVFVSNIPLDATFDEIHDVFKRYGIVDRGFDKKPRIKMYTNDNGEFNGEALIVYFKKDSVPLAIQLQNDYEFKMGETANGTTRVQEADPSFKRHKDADHVAATLVRKDRKAAERNRAELNRYVVFSPHIRVLCR